MYKNKRIVAVTPAGRKRYLEILKKYVLNCEFIDEWQIWQNTNNIEDIAYFKELAKEDKRVVIETRDFNYHSQCSQAHVINADNIYRFFDKCILNDHVYVRFDDDIVWMNYNSIKNLIDFRIDNPEYFIVYGSIINNAICDYIHQKLGALRLDQNRPLPLGYDCLDHQGWNNPFIAERKHRCLLAKIKSNQLSKYYYNRWILYGYERVSINVISWLGEEFAKFNGIVDYREEPWLAVDKPKEIGKPNCICGTALFAHFSFFPQRPYLDTTDILEQYRKISLQQTPFKTATKNDIPII